MSRRDPDWFEPVHAAYLRGEEGYSTTVHRHDVRRELWAAARGLLPVVVVSVPLSIVALLVVL